MLYRVNVGGKLDVICFDKTGTLTEDGLDVLGVRIVHRPAMRYGIECLSIPTKLIIRRFSDVLGDASSLLPGAAYERDPTVDYQIHKAVLNTMATCHALRAVEGELLGDPLDVKMFEFTGWTFEELAQRINVSDDAAQNIPTSIARPPAGVAYGIDETEQSAAVGNPPNVASITTDCALSQHTPIELGNLKSFDFVSQLRRASVVVGQSGSSGGDVYVKGAPECMRDICHPDSCEYFGSFPRTCCS